MAALAVNLNLETKTLRIVSVITHVGMKICYLCTYLFFAEGVWAGTLVAGRIARVIARSSLYGALLTAANAS